MNYYICIDDTDTLTSIGTGEIAENMALSLEKMNYGRTNKITRHQLLFHPDIPYTSHNSSMCFELLDSETELENIIGFCSQYLESNSAEGSDPGLCIVNANSLHDKSTLIDFGYRAKKEILTKELAYSVAQKLEIHLSEHGGTGQGIIGALAGTGLRMEGNDGRYKGKVFFGENCDNMIVRDILSHPAIDKVMSIDGYELKEDEVVFIADRIKTIRKNSNSVLLVEKLYKVDDWYWKDLGKEQLKKY